MERTVVDARVLRTIDRSSIRVYVPPLNQYRDLNDGILFLRVDDPAYDFMMAWAEREPNVSISGDKEGKLACSICHEILKSGDDAISEHYALIHIEPATDEGDHQEETERPRTEVTKQHLVAARAARRARVDAVR